MKYPEQISWNNRKITRIKAVLMLECPSKGLVEAGETFDSTCDGCGYFCGRVNDVIACDYEHEEE